VVVVAVVKEEACRGDSLVLCDGGFLSVCEVVCVDDEGVVCLSGDGESSCSRGSFAR